MFKPEENVMCDDMEELENSLLQLKGFQRFFFDLLQKPIPEDTSTKDSKVEDKSRLSSNPSKQNVMETGSIVHAPKDEKMIQE